MATVKHPRTGDVLTVPDERLADWLAQGWIDTAPKRADEVDEPKSARHRKNPSRDDVR